LGHLATLPEATERSAAWRAAGRTVVLTNGCFDLLHVGHVNYLQQARALGDVLIVGINGDDSVRRLKGLGRPLVPAIERATLVAALAAVDLTVIFEDNTAIELLHRLRPHVYTKGGDWGQPGGRRLPELEDAQKVGAAVYYVPYLPGHSTGGLIQRILERMSTPRG
jgi:rfaE bifunctional protein nucleotidyltransferase chain/domain